MCIFISAQENYDWNVYKSLQTLALGESHEKELSDEKTRDRKRTLSRLMLLREGGDARTFQTRRHQPNVQVNSRHFVCLPVCQNRSRRATGSSGLALDFIPCRLRVKASSASSWCEGKITTSSPQRVLIPKR